MADGGGKRIRLEAKWVKSHITEEPGLIRKYPTTLREVFGNGCADRLAERAALGAEIPAREAEEVDKVRALCTQIQQRLLCILSDLVARFPRQFNRVKLGCMGAHRKFSQMTLKSSHRIVLRQGPCLV